MGILNITPDSFSDGGLYDDSGAAVERALEMVEQGADLLDVGGESTRPGSTPVDAEAEEGRVLPVVRALRKVVRVPISIDTRRARVARAALDEGAAIVNDVSGLKDPEMPKVVAEAGAGLIVMHMRGTPATMQDDPRYEDVVEEVRAELERSVGCALQAGVHPSRIAIDPGIGFGKNQSHNLELIARIDRLADTGRPVVLGISRKRFLGEIVGEASPAERGVATAAGCVVGLLNGARIFRVHDVRLVRQALDVAFALQSAAV